MDRLLQEKCDLLLENKKTISETFKWAPDAIRLAAALIFTAAGRRAEKEELKAAEAILQARAGAFSVFRGGVKLPVLCRMILSGDPEGCFEEINGLYELLSARKWLTSDFNALAAVILSEYTDKMDAGTLISRASEIYLLTRERHPRLTTREDMVFAALLAASDEDIAGLADEAEQNYSILKEAFADENAVRSLSQVLALGGKPAEEKSAKVITLYYALINAGRKYGEHYELAALGALALTDIPYEQLTDEMAEADDYLKGHKGFGNFRLGAYTRRMYAAQMAALRHAPSASGRGSLALRLSLITLISSVTVTAAVNT